MYSAFIADVDPVATLAAFNKIKVDPLLQTLVGGEATLNDPVAIVLFQITNQRKKELGGIHVMSEVGTGIALLLLSTLIGLGLALITTLLQRLSGIRGNQVLEATFLVANAYALFAAGEMAGQSGIIAALFGGLVHGIYARQNLSPETESESIAVLATAARAADILIFAIVGFCLIGIADDEGALATGFGFLTVLFCLVARFIMLAWMVPVVNLFKKMRGAPTIGFGMSFMIWHSQLRGGMTLLLALMINPYWTDNKPLYVDATIVCIVVLAVLCGVTCPTALKFAGVPSGIEADDGTLAPDPTKALQTISQLDQPLRWLLTHDDTHPDHPSQSQYNAAQ